MTDIKALKPDPDNQIWSPPSPRPGALHGHLGPAQGGQNTQAGELWPQSCTPAGRRLRRRQPRGDAAPTDGSFGDPAVRITQFANAFPNSVLGSICDASFGGTLGVLANMIAQPFQPNP